MFETWKDASSYSRGTKPEDRVPTVWELKLEACRIVVHRIVGIRDAWFLSCNEAGIKDRPIGEGLEAEEAKRRAMKYMRWNLEERARAAMEGVEVLDKALNAAPPHETASSMAAGAND